jgi:hypothetical protein
MGPPSGVLVFLTHEFSVWLLSGVLVVSTVVSILLSGVVAAKSSRVMARSAVWVLAIFIAVVVWVCLLLNGFRQGFLTNSGGAAGKLS